MSAHNLPFIDACEERYGLHPSNTATANRLICKKIVDDNPNGAHVYIRPGTFLLDVDGATFGPSILLKSNFTWEGSGQTTVLKMAAGVPTFSRTFQTLGMVVYDGSINENIHIRKMTIDGNRAVNPVTEQNHGILGFGFRNCTFTDLYVLNQPGDGISLNDGCRGVVVERVKTRNCHRNGITMGGGNTATSDASNITITDCDLEADIQCVDIEAYDVASSILENIKVTHNTLTSLAPIGTSAPICVAVSGGSYDTATGIRDNIGVDVSHNHMFGGGVVVNGSDRVSIGYNTIILGTTPIPEISAIQCYHQQKNVRIFGNTITHTRAAATTQPLIDVASTATTGENLIKNFQFKGNVVTTVAPNQQMSSFWGIGGDLDISDNTFNGSGSSTSANIWVRSTTAGSATGTVNISNNRFTGTDAGQAGILISDFGGFNFKRIAVIDNYFDSGLRGVLIGVATTVPMRIEGNVCETAVPIPMSVFGPTFWHVSGSNRDVGVWSGTGTPLNVVVAGIGSTYHRIDGGAATSFYVKESGAGASTGWVPK